MNNAITAYPYPKANYPVEVQFPTQITKKTVAVHSFPDSFHTWLPPVLFSLMDPRNAICHPNYEETTMPGGTASGSGGVNRPPRPTMTAWAA